jgi:hypothetical protein
MFMDLLGIKIEISHLVECLTKVEHTQVSEDLNAKMRSQAVRDAIDPLTTCLFVYTFIN